MIKLSVVIPMFRAKYIGWLPFESLIRQKNINFEWELIVAEEIYDESMGEFEVYKYKDQLKDLGCVKFEYISLEKWISLAEKLYLLVQNCSDSSKVFVWHSADYYSAPFRLMTHYKNFLENDIHLSSPLKAIYYNIADNSIALHDTTNCGRKNDVMGKAWDINVVKQIPKQDRRSCVDSWLYFECNEISNGLKIHFDESDNWKYALSTHGFNNITFHRENKIKNPIQPFYSCPINIFETIPEKILRRLRECKKDLKKHKKGLPR